MEVAVCLTGIPDSIISRQTKHLTFPLRCVARFDVRFSVGTVNFNPVFREAGPAVEKLSKAHDPIAEETVGILASYYY